MTKRMIRTTLTGIAVLLSLAVLSLLPAKVEAAETEVKVCYSDTIYGQSSNDPLMISEGAAFRFFLDQVCSVPGMPDYITEAFMTETLHVCMVNAADPNDRIEFLFEEYLGEDCASVIPPAGTAGKDYYFIFESEKYPSDRVKSEETVRIASYDCGTRSVIDLRNHIYGRSEEPFRPSGTVPLIGWDWEEEDAQAIRHTLTGSYFVTWKSGDSAEGLDDYLIANIDLDKNGSDDIRVLDCIHDSEMQLWALDTNSVRGDFSLRLPDSKRFAMNIDDHPYYSTLTFRLSVPLERAEITLDPDTYAYTGKTIKPNLKIVYDGKTLVPDTDYYVAYGNAVYPGTADAIIAPSPSSCLTGTVIRHFTITKAPQDIRVSGTSFTKIVGDAAFDLGASTNGDGALTYTSDNPAAAAVDSSGKVTIKGAGTAKITVRAEETNHYTRSEKTISVTVKSASDISVVAGAITAITDDKRDAAGSTFGLLQARGEPKSNTSIKLSWKKVSGAVRYVIYGNKCGRGNRYREITSVTKRSYTQKQRKKGTYYKYIVVAVNKNSQAIAVSKTVHVATGGGRGKKGNAASVKLNVKSKLTLKKGKTKKLKCTVKYGKLKGAVHRKTAWESSNPAVATVSSGKIKAVARGSCTIYAYAQNGKMAKVKVTVR